MDLETYLADGSGNSPLFLKDLGTPLADGLETHLADGPGDSPV
jgi:hypothetical protein